MTEIPATRERGQLKYWGFISYSHSDKKIVKRIQKKLESYRIPKSRVGTPSPIGLLPTRIRPFFRDEDALPMSPDLAAPIQAALRQSRSLVVICSPRSAKSEYVNEEVLFFKRLSQDERCSCIILEGQPRYPEISDDECFCDALRFQMGPNGELTNTVVEPLAGNAANTSIDQECIRVIATITAIPFDELWDRFRRDRLRITIVWSILIFSLLSVLGVISNIAIEARKEAVAEKKRADDELETRRFSQYLSLFASAEKDLLQDDYATAASKLAACPEDLRDWEWYYLSHRISPAVALLQFPEARLVAVDLAPDGILIAAGTIDGRVVIWNRETGKTFRILDHSQSPERVRLRGDTASVTNVKYSPDGTRLISVSSDGKIIVWNMNSYTIQKVIAGTGLVADWFPNSRDIVRLSESNLIVWDTETESVKATMDGNVFGISALDVTADGRFLAMADSTARVRVWDTQTGRLRQQMNHAAGGVYTVAIQPRGDLVAGGTDTGAIIVWNIENGNEIRRLRGHVGPVHALDWKFFEAGFEKFDDQLVSGGEDKTVKVWNPLEDQAMTTLRGHQEPVNGVSWSPGGQFIASSSRDATVRLWNPVNAAHSVTLPGNFRKLRSLTVSQDSIFASGVEPFPSDPNRPIGNKVMIRWERQHPGNIRTFGDVHSGQAIALTNVGEEMSGLFEDGKIRVWNSRTLRPRVSAGRLKGTPVDLVASHDETKLWACSKEGTLWMLNTESLTELHNAVLEQPSITGMHVLEHQILTTSTDGKLRVWDSTHFRKQAEVRICDCTISSSCLDYKNRLIYLSGTDGTFSIFSIKDRELRRRVHLLYGPALSLAVHPGGQRIAVGHEDGAISLLDVQGRLLITLHGHRDSVDHLQFSADGESLFSASENGTVIQWRAPR